MASAADFAITAYQKAGCIQDRTEPFDFGRPGHEPCEAAIAFSDERLQFDGWVAMLAVVMVSAAAVFGSRTHRRAKLLLLSSASALVVVTVVIIFTILWPVFARGT
jgi:hypothetical protein